MYQTLSQFFAIVYDKGRRQGPFPLPEEGLDQVNAMPLCVMGILNPFGPTLVAINWMFEEGKPAGALLATSLNPFSQSRLIYSSTPNTLTGALKVFGEAVSAGEGPLLGCPPDLVVTDWDDAALAGATRRMVHALVLKAPSTDPLKTLTQKFKAHRGNPWARLPPAAEMLKAALAKQAPPSARPSEQEFKAWFDVVSDPEHIASELLAITQAWQGSLGMAKGLPGMELKEVAIELEALGFPLLTPWKPGR